MSDAEWRRFEAECKNAVEKWKRKHNPKIHLPSSDYYGGWGEILRYMLD